MLEICIVEDMPEIRKKMAQLVNDYCLFSEVDAGLSLATSDPFLALEFFKSAENTVLFFLDIDLGAKIDGMELAAKLRELNKPCFIVFFTTKSEMAPLTFKYQLEALDFVVKDSDEEEIKDRIRSCIRTAFDRQVRVIGSPMFVFKQEDKVVQIPMDDILYVETTGTRYKLNLYTTSRRITMNGELKKVEEELDDRFVRCHQSYLVNRDHIAEYDFPGNELKMTDGSIVLMSRTGKKLLK